MRFREQIDCSRLLTFIYDAWQEEKVKGHIDLHGYRVLADSNPSAGNYGFQIVHDSDKPHYFSSGEHKIVKEWMKQLMKATITRDYSAPVVSSCNIPTIPLKEAQALQPRPPSPGARDAAQRASRRENPNQLTARDASVLVSRSLAIAISLGLCTYSNHSNPTSLLCNSDGSRQLCQLATNISS